MHRKCSAYQRLTVSVFQFDPAKGPISKHTLVQTHERSGRPVSDVVLPQAPDHIDK